MTITTTSNQYFYQNQQDQYTFYRIPKALIKGVRYQHVTMEAKLLYGCLLYTSFGYQGAGNPEKLQELCSQYGISVTVMEPCCVDDEIVSSSTIRSYLKDGRIEKVNEMLGYVYTVSGVVCQGNQIGRTIGFPTANIMAVSYTHLRRERIAIRVCKRIGTADRLYHPERFPSAAE